MKRFYQIALTLVALSCVGAMSYLPHRRAAFRGGGAYTANSTTFTTNSYQTATQASLGLSDSKVGIVSFWIKPDSNSFVGGTKYVQNNLGGRLDIRFEPATGVSTIIGKNSSGSTIFQVTASTGGEFSAGNWYHVLASWDLASGIASTHYYINGVNRKKTGGTATDDFIDHANGNSIVVGDHYAGGYSGCISEFYYNLSESIDFSSQANREKFALSGVPVDLGSDGSTPTGTSPEVYLKSAYSSFEVNSGSGGDFTVTGGPYTSCESPSY